MNYNIEQAKEKDIDIDSILELNGLKAIKNQWSRYSKSHSKEEFLEATKSNDFNIIKQNNKLVAFETALNPDDSL